MELLTGYYTVDPNLMSHVELRQLFLSTFIDLIEYAKWIDCRKYIVITIEDAYASNYIAHKVN